MPDLIIIAGANGVGKTTFARPYSKEYGYDFLNADDLAQELSERGERSPMIAAGRVFFGKLNEFLEKKKSVVVETTLSGTYINKVAARAKAMSYKITVIYVFVSDPKTCMERVKMRRAKGGHDVPEEDIERRFYRSFDNFWLNFRGIADEWELHYNGDFGFQLVSVGNSNEMQVENRILLDLFTSILNQNEGSKKT